MKIKPISIRFAKQEGFSLLEALLSIVIILAAGLGVVELFISADKRNKLQTTEQIAQQSASAANQLLSATYDPSDIITTDDVINSGLMPQNVIVGGAIQGPYGTFDVASDSVNGNGGDNTHEQFYVVANNLPADQAVGFCQNMIGNFAVFAGAGTGASGSAISTVAGCAKVSTGASSDRLSVTLAYPRANYIS